MKPYKFCETATPEKPVTSLTTLLEKVMSEGLSKLSRSEKDQIATTLYGIFGSHSSTYKLSGWAWSMAPYLKRILVSTHYEPHMFRAYYAPDKTSLRKVIGPVYEMIFAPTKTQKEM
jgi:hypothetical protein